jgi:RNA polymerase sigma-70 factor (ECF subfamily)
MRGRAPSRPSSGAMTPSGCARALSRLPLLYQSTLALRFLDEWSYERIAELEEVSVSALRSRIHKGLQLLRSELQELADGEGPASLEGSHD